MEITKKIDGVKSVFTITIGPDDWTCVDNRTHKHYKANAILNHAYATKSSACNNVAGLGYDIKDPFKANIENQLHKYIMHNRTILSNIRGTDNFSFEIHSKKPIQGLFNVIIVITMDTDAGDVKSFQLANCGICTSDKYNYSPIDFIKKHNVSVYLDEHGTEYLIGHTVDADDESIKVNVHARKSNDISQFTYDKVFRYTDDHGVCKYPNGRSYRFRARIVAKFYSNGKVANAKVIIAKKSNYRYAIL